MAIGHITGRTSNGTDSGRPVVRILRRVGVFEQVEDAVEADAHIEEIGKASFWFKRCLAMEGHAPPMERNGVLHIAWNGSFHAQRRKARLGAS